MSISFYAYRTTYKSVYIAYVICIHVGCWLLGLGSFMEMDQFFLFFFSSYLFIHLCSHFLCAVVVISHTFWRFLFEYLTVTQTLHVSAMIRSLSYLYWCRSLCGCRNSFFFLPVLLEKFHLKNNLYVSRKLWIFHFFCAPFRYKFIFLFILSFFVTSDRIIKKKETLYDNESEKQQQECA